MTRRLLKYIGWGFITAAGYRVTRGYNETRPPVCLKVNSVSFIDFFRSDFVQESRFKGFCQQEWLKVAFFRKYDAFFSLPQKCENYPEKDVLKLCSV